MNILMIGANGYMGPHVVDVLAPDHHLRITDVQPAPEELRARHADHEFFDLDVTQRNQVLKAAEGMDAIINLAVVRQHRELAFQVNTLGCYHVMQAAVQHGIRRVINTGPHFTVAGPTYEDFDFAINPDVPPHPGTGLYPLTKSLGQEICRAFTREHEIYVLDLLFYILRETDQIRSGAMRVPFVVSWSDAARAFQLALQVPPHRLASRCEVFFILGDLPQQKFLNDKAARILGFRPQDDVAAFWDRDE
jgi:nucleoside-diphosphate-sugar epimerase